MYMRETGTICQIGVSTAEQCIVWAQKGPFSAISHYKSSNAIKHSACATVIENVVQNRRKLPLLDPETVPFRRKNANLTNGTYSRAHMYGIGGKRGKVSKNAMSFSSPWQYKFGSCNFDCRVRNFVAISQLPSDCLCRCALF